MKLRRTKLKGNNRLCHFLRRSVILSTITVDRKGRVNPGTLPLALIVDTYERMTLLHDLVTCTPSTLFQFCSIRLDEIFSCTFQEYIDNISLSDLVAEEFWCHDEISQCATLSGFGGEEDYSPDFSQEYYSPDFFFDTYLSIQSLTTVAMDLDFSYFFDSCDSIFSLDEFFDCLPPYMPNSSFFDWPTLDDFSSNVYLD